MSEAISGDKIDTKSEAAQYIYKFISASLAGEFPYIEGSDEETQGIIKIKRKISYVGNNESTLKEKDLTYIGYKKFQEMLKSEDRKTKEKALDYFSIDENWNLCIAKYSRTIVNDKETAYKIQEVKIPYRGMVSEYTMPFLFLIDLQLITNNANYVEAVANLMREQSEIEFTIFDSITTDDMTYEYKEDKHTKTKSENIGSQYAAAAGGEYVYSTHCTDTKTTTYTETDKIKANVTKAKTWIIEQETNYEIQTTKEYPYGPEGTLKEYEDEKMPEEEGSWITNKSEYWYEENIENEWVKSGDTKTLIKPSEFMGLWKNETGKYVQGAPYTPYGKIVEYTILDSTNIDRPIINIITAREELYGLLENSEKTQTHAELMKEIINFYLSGKELTDEFGSKFKDIFDPNEFIETNWNALGSGFWWPIKDTSFTRITSKFGPRNIGLAGASTFHQGIDIGVPVGTEIIAVADGTVEATGFGSKSGMYVKINHGNGIKTVYMHNSDILVTMGQQVKQGDVIALSGNTGNSTGPHLHFGIEVNGEYVDPLNYVDPANPRPSGIVPDVPAKAEAWRPYVEQAFEELGYEMTEEKVGAILRQIATESGGNQNIIQGITDSNSGKTINIGDGTCPWCPSSSGKSCGNTNIGHGLLQFIPTTFYGNMISGHSNIYNGYDQICTCITMLERRSGSYTDYIGNGHGWG